jgi:hypothetical protein
VRRWFALTTYGHSLGSRARFQRAKDSRHQPTPAFAPAASPPKANRSTRRLCRINSFIMYGMNQGYGHAPDPSAQVPNHLVSAPVAPRPPSPTNSIARPCASDIFIPFPYAAGSPSPTGPRVPHQRPPDRARHLSRRVDLPSSPSPRWHRYPHMAAPAHGNHVRLGRNGLG